MTIRKLLAAMFLLLFCFSVTPKRFLHDMLANHRDVQTMPRLPVEQINSSGFHCHIDDLVVEAPFLPGIYPSVSPDAACSIFVYTEPVFALSLLYLSHAVGRGPPTCSVLS